MLRYRLFRVRSEKLEILKAWAEELRQRSSEVAAAMEHENVSAETLHAFQIDGAWYAMGMQSLSGKHRRADMSVELNRRHLAIMEACLEPHDGGFAIYEFQR